MPSRWFINHCTDSRLRLTDDEVRLVNRQVRVLTERDRSTLVAAIVGIPVALIVGGIGSVLLSRALRQHVGSAAADWISGMSVMMTLSVGWLFVSARLYRRVARRAMVDCGFPICVGCGYLLEGVEGDVCPECGREIERREGSAR